MFYLPQILTKLISLHKEKMGFFTNDDRFHELLWKTFGDEYLELIKGKEDWQYRPSGGVIYQRLVDLLKI